MKKPSLEGVDEELENNGNRRLKNERRWMIICMNIDETKNRLEEVV